MADDRRLEGHDRPAGRERGGDLRMDAQQRLHDATLSRGRHGASVPLVTRDQAVDPTVLMVRDRYPRQWEADVLLRDGSAAHIRPIRVDDADGLIDLHSRLSEQTIYFRFFAPYPVLSARDVERFTRVDYDDRVALVVTVGDEIVGVVRYDRLSPGGDEAEVAFVVRDDYQGYGLGSVLLEHLVGAARERGVRRFVADVLPANERMLSVFAAAGYASTREIEDGVVRLELAIEPTATSLAVTETREHRAEARSIERLLAPGSVVVVGAGRQPSGVGATVLRNLVEGGFTGRIYAVNPEAHGDLYGVPTYDTVAEVPERVDLAVLATPADTLPSVVADCAARGVHALVVLSAGFAEAGDEGRERQRALVDAAHAAGMRVVGPNCLGLINTHPALRLNASLASSMPLAGRIGFFSQSGALGIALLQALRQRGLGVSTFVSAGNRADVSGNDLMQFWEEDEETDIVLLYLESIGNPRKFSRIARRTSRSKPIVAVKSGRSTQGIPLGHRVRATELPSTAVDEMFDQCGVIQVETLSEMFDVALVLSYQQLPAGRRVRVVSNSDALAVLAADACASRGLELVSGGARGLWPSIPVEEFGAALSEAGQDVEADAVIVLFVPPVGDSGQGYAREIARVSRETAKPVVATMLAVEGISELLQNVNPDGVPVLGSVPTFGSVEDAVRALASVTDYADWRRRPDGKVPELPDVDRDRADSLVARLLRDHPDGVDVEGDELTELLGSYGIELRPMIAVRTADEAVAAAESLGYPVVVKAVSRTLVHRTDLGGVRVDLGTPGDVRWAVGAMVEQFGPWVRDSLVVQQMTAHGVSCVIGATEDDLFGPVVSFRLGGVVTELVEDRGYRIPPVTDVDAHELVRAPKASPLLLGHRGGPPLDTVELENLIVRVAQLSDDLPELVEVELNPVVATATGAAVLGATARVAPVLLRADTRARRLPKA